jgi:hypothetical protein
MPFPRDISDTRTAIWRATDFQANDEGSIPFTRSIFKIKDLSERLGELNAQPKSAGGNVRGNKRPDFRLHPREQDYAKPADRRRRHVGDSRPPSTPATSIGGSQVRVLLCYLARRNNRKLPRKFHLGAWEESLGGLVVHLQLGLSNMASAKSYPLVSRSSMLLATSSQTSANSRLLLDNGIFGLFGKLSIHNRLLPQILVPLHTYLPRKT